MYQKNSIFDFRLTSSCRYGETPRPTTNPADTGKRLVQLPETPAVHRAGPPPRMDRNSGCWYPKKMEIKFIHKQRGALRGSPGSACPQPEPMPLSCLVALLSQRELHKDGGGGGGVEARKARAARAPKGQFLRQVL